MEDFVQKALNLMKITNTDLRGKTCIVQYGDNRLQHRLYIRRVSPQRENSDRIYTTFEPSYASEIHSLTGQLFLSSFQHMFVSFSVLLPMHVVSMFFPLTGFGFQLTFHLPLQLKHVN